MKNLMIILGIVASSVAAYCQDFKASKLFDAYGNIKQIKYKTQDPLLDFKNVKFDKDGKLKNSMIFYDEAGFPKGIDLNFGPLSFNITFLFDKYNLTNVKLIRTKPNPVELDIKYEFLNGVMTTESAVSSEKKDTTNYQYSFSDYIKDDKGNWISRNVNLIITNPSGTKEKTKTYTETREIKYWD